MLLERELALIDASLAAAAAGSASVLQLEGEAGVGKNALLDRAATTAAERGFGVLTARAGVLERSRGFGVARQLFERAVVRGLDGEPSSSLTSLGFAVAPLPSGIDPCCYARGRGASTNEASSPTAT